MLKNQLIVESSLQQSQISTMAEVSPRKFYLSKVSGGLNTKQSNVTFENIYSDKNSNNVSITSRANNQSLLSKINTLLGGGSSLNRNKNSNNFNHGITIVESDSTAATTTTKSFDS